MSEKRDKPARKTLTDEDIRTRPVTRRSAIGAIGASVLGAAAIVLGGNGCVEATEVESTEGALAASDSDPSDPAGRGRTGYTDRDSGASADGAGRGVCPERGASDTDPNDPAGRGRGPCH